MKGYIALSRVKKVDDLYLPQAFSPALFQQGPQPWPSLLIQFLKGEHDVSRLEEMAAEAAQKCKKPTLLKDLKWPCGKCAKTFSYTGFLVKGKYVEEEWYTAYWEKIIAPGHGRLCIQCKGESQEERFTCAVCRKAKPKVAFPHSMWHHRTDKDQRCLCLDCCRPRCTSQHCKTCPVCRDEGCKNKNCAKAIQPLHWKLLPRTMQDVETYLCLNCRCEYECAVCGIAKTQAGFPESMWHNRHSKDQRILCFDCCRPRCTSQHCKTCPVCRDKLARTRIAQRRLNHCIGSFCHEAYKM